MSIRFTTKARRGVVALTVAAGLALGVVGCGGGSDDDKKPTASDSASKGDNSGPSPQGGQADERLAEGRGQAGLLLARAPAAGGAGGLRTTHGGLQNGGAKRLAAPAVLRGNGWESIRHGRTLGGATLVDSTGTPRYYVRRD